MTRDEVENLLKEINYPNMNKDIITLGIVKTIDFNDDNLVVDLDLRTDNDQDVCKAVK